MTRNNQKWYDKPVTKLILVAIALVGIFIYGRILERVNAPKL